MGKYKKEPKQPLVIVSVRFEQSTIDGVADFHDNFSEFVRDAVDAYIIEQKKLIKLNGE